MSTISECKMQISEFKNKKQVQSPIPATPVRQRFYGGTTMMDGCNGKGMFFLRNPQSPIRNGFTLLEVLISLAIISFTLVVLIHSQMLSTEQGTKAKYYTTAVFLGNRVLSDTFMQNEVPDGSYEEDFPDYPEFAWSREVEDTQFDELKKVNIVILGPENTKLVMSTFWRKK